MLYWNRFSWLINFWIKSNLLRLWIILSLIHSSFMFAGTFLVLIHREWWINLAFDPSWLQIIFLWDSLAYLLWIECSLCRWSIELLGLLRYLFKLRWIDLRLSVKLLGSFIVLRSIEEDFTLVVRRSEVVLVRSYINLLLRYLLTL